MTEKAVGLTAVLVEARNIVNQIGDLYSEKIKSKNWIPVRQSTNDELDLFVAKILVSSGSDIRNAAFEEAALIAERDLCALKDCGNRGCIEARKTAKLLRDEKDIPQ